MYGPTASVLREHVRITYKKLEKNDPESER